MVFSINILDEKLKIIQGNSLTYLNKLEDGSVGSFFTGVPEMDEMNMNQIKYRAFVRKTCRLLFKKVSLDGISSCFS
jgi:hypothetical protein